MTMKPVLFCKTPETGEFSFFKMHFSMPKLFIENYFFISYDVIINFYIWKSLNFFQEGDVKVSYLTLEIFETH